MKQVFQFLLIYLFFSLFVCFLGFFVFVFFFWFRCVLFYFVLFFCVCVFLFLYNEFKELQSVYVTTFNYFIVYVCCVWVCVCDLGEAVSVVSGFALEAKPPPQPGKDTSESTFL